MGFTNCVCLPRSRLYALRGLACLYLQQMVSPGRFMQAASQGSLGVVALCIARGKLGEIPAEL